MSARTLARRFRALRLALGPCALAAAMLSSPVAAQTNTGTTIGDFLLIEPSARITGMGNAGAALAEGLQSVYYNPATIGLLKQKSVEFSSCNWLADIAYHYAAASLPVTRYSNVFASVTALNSGDIDVRTVDQPLGTGEKYSVTDVGLSAGYGRMISDRFSAGVQVQYLQETIWHSSVATVTLSVGTEYQLSPHGLHLGAAITNFGTQARFGGRDLSISYDVNPDANGDNNQLPGVASTDLFAVPVLFRVGAGLPIRLGRETGLNVAVDALHPNDNTESVNAGMELVVHNALCVRAGYQTLWQQDSEEGLTFGAGIRGGGETKYHVDYAWADEGRLGSTSRFTLGLEF